MAVALTGLGAGAAKAQNKPAPQGKTSMTIDSAAGPIVDQTEQPRKPIPPPAKASKDVGPLLNAPNTYDRNTYTPDMKIYKPQKQRA
jgi:hypothetical protein